VEVAANYPRRKPGQGEIESLTLPAWAAAVLQADFSESTFGFGVAHAIQRVADTSKMGPPIFPSLRQEKRLGFDVAFPGLHLFLQFKLSQRMTRANALQWKSHWNKEYLRFDLRHKSPRDSQHNLLARFSASFPYFIVRYCAPLFVSGRDFTTYHVRRTLLENCLWLDPARLGTLKDRDRHCVTFLRDASGVTYHRHSEEETGGRAAFAEEDLRGAIAQHTETHPLERRRIDASEIRRVHGTLLQMAQERYHQLAETGTRAERKMATERLSVLGEPRTDVKPRELVERISLLASVELGAEWIILPDTGEA
jgi:hypothetical protein